MDSEARQKSAPADPAALAAAMGFAGASEEARAYLAKQSRLSDLQMVNNRLQNERLEKLDEYETSHLRWRLKRRDYASGDRDRKGGACRNAFQRLRVPASPRPPTIRSIVP